MAQQESYEVKVAIYDLSKGMARSLSAQFLGPNFALDAIPHTGILVYGREYFFGGGIQSEDPEEFRRNTGMRPFQLETIGRTTVPRSQFEKWCGEVMNNGLYNAASYDLITRNCNNFCHDAALQGLRLSRGVPAWVLEVPQKFLSSPMGQLVVPMLQNMQISNVRGAEHVAPFANAAPSLTNSTQTATTNNNDNPWASIPSSKPTEDSKSTTNNKGTPLLDSFNKPLLSSDTKMVKMCISKLQPGLNDDIEKQQQMEKAAELLQRGSELEKDLAMSTCGILLDFLNNGFQITFSLFFLRIVVLKSTNTAWSSCVDWIGNELSKTKDPSSSLISSPMARSAAWLTASNAFGREPSLSRLDLFVDAAVSDISEMSQPRIEVRQAACSFLYNVALVKGAEITLADGGTEIGSSDAVLSDLLVSLLCSSLEGVDKEPDSTCRLRRLMVIGRILKPSENGDNDVRESAKGLISDLGFVPSLENVPKTPIKGPDSENCQKLALELLQLVV